MKTIKRIALLSILFFSSFLGSCEGPIDTGKRDESANEPSLAEKNEARRRIARIKADSSRMARLIADSARTYNNQR